MKRVGTLALIATPLLFCVGLKLAWAQDSVQPPAANGADPYALPAGGPQLLSPFILQLMRQRPQNAEEQAKIQQAILKAADKLLAGKPSNEQLLLAVRAKSAILQDPEELAVLEADLKKRGKKLPARIVHMRLLAVQLDRSRSDVAAFRKAFEEVKQFFSDGSLQAGDEQLALRAGQAAERTGNAPLAAETYDSLAKLLPLQMPFGATVKRLQASARRWHLPGNSMRLEGKMLDGKAFDAADFRGKVVLVDFWATWCGPCKAEIPNMKKVYEDYHDKGFEVVGISIDSGPREQLVEFVAKEEIPWSICRDGDSPAKIAEYYGINAIPAMILIGRDGKVVSLNARGAGLGPLVEKALAATAGAADDREASGQANVDEETGPAKAKTVRAKPKAEETADSEKKAVEPPKAIAAAMRTWTDASGKFKIEAKFRGILNKNVKLECADGRVVTLPLEKLSGEDQTYIKKRKYGSTPQ